MMIDVQSQILKTLKSIDARLERIEDMQELQATYALRDIQPSLTRWRFGTITRFVSMLRDCKRPISQVDVNGLPLPTATITPRERIDKTGMHVITESAYSDEGEGDVL